jgi:hypothetical protein
VSTTGRETLERRHATARLDSRPIRDDRPTAAHRAGASSRAVPRHALKRRTFLRGALGGGVVAVGLPLLEAMLDDHGEAHADGTPRAPRFVSWFFGNGVYLPNFEPAQTGPGFPLSPALEAFAPVQSYLTVCTGLWNRSRSLMTHHEGMTVFSGYNILPTFTPKPFSSHMGGPTIDQLVANTIADDTPVRAIHVGCDRKLSVADGGTTLAALSHAGPNQPEYPEHSPAKVWQQLFGAVLADDTHLRLGILDAVNDDLGRLQKRLGSVDKAILDKHLEGVLALEKKIGLLSCQAPAAVTETNPDVVDQDLTKVNDLMDDLITMAFKCDITRVATNLFHYGGSHFHFHMLGQSAYEHHGNNSHYGGDAMGRYTEVVKYIMSRLAHLAISLHDEQEPDGKNLLDATIIFASSDCAFGWSHTLRRQPVLLVGHGHGKLVHPGIHHQAVPYGGAEGSPDATGNTSDVLLTVLQAFDPGAIQIGDMDNTGGNVDHEEPPGSVTPLEAIRGES